ncbi:MAG: hypothetical protein NUV98_07330 [Candidatus Roizmanbacteria bacterium]|nr:hypothetical protein [Candidatus Roizmanbacteria bacterium]
MADHLISPAGTHPDAAKTADNLRRAVMVRLIKKSIQEKQIRVDSLLAEIDNDESDVELYEKGLK